MSASNQKTLSTQELELLSKTIGKTIVSFEANRLNGITYYEKVKLLLDDTSLVVSNSFEPADVGYVRGDTPGEAGCLHVVIDEDPLVLSDVVNGPSNSIVPIGSRVIGVEIANDQIQMLRDGEETNCFSFTQAIIFHLEQGDLVIDRNIWFEVFIDVYVTADGKRSLRDTAKEWSADDDSAYEGVVRREFITL